MRTFRYSAGVAIVVCLAVAAYSQGTESGEWRHYGGDLKSSKYSPLEQINSENFGQLQIAWRWRSVDQWISKSVAGGEWWAKSDAVFEDLQDDDAKRWRGGLAPRLGGLKATPIMVDGILYLTTALYQAAAVDAKTGETLWVYNPKSYESGTPTMSIFWNHRGVEYWEDELGEDRRIYWGTGDAYLICVDAKTGRPCKDFGSDGRVDLTNGLPRAERTARDYLNALMYSCASPPIIAGDTIITGASIADRRIMK